jgi:hypothetical protein
MGEVEDWKEKKIKFIWNKFIEAAHFVIDDVSIDEVEVYDWSKIV